MTPTIHHGDCRAILAGLQADSIDACITDPPYHLTGSKGATGGFMGQAWDGGDVAFQADTWRQVMRVLKPGAHLLAFGGTRTFHRLAVAIEDAGFELRDTVMWLHGQGFPKGTNIGAAAGPDWQGWNTSLKPGWEPVIMARKPFAGSVACNVLEYGTGGLNVGACQVAVEGDRPLIGKKVGENDTAGRNVYGLGMSPGSACLGTTTEGRWPANVIHDGSEGVLAAFDAFGDRKGGAYPASRGAGGISTSGHAGQRDLMARPTDGGSVSRFFYCAKAGEADRAGSKHPTIKPVALMRYLCRLITPPGGQVLDPFAGSGPTGEAAMLEGFAPVLIELQAQYVVDIGRRLGRLAGADTPLFAEA